MSSSVPHIIQLNVGGQRYTTSKETLQKPGTMLAAMFSGDLQNRQDEQGAVFIDRDPKHFRCVLNYLRDSACTLPESHDERMELLREAQFYQIEGLMAELSTLTAASGFPSGLRQRVVDNVLAQPELKTIMDYVIKVSFDESKLSLGHLLGVACCLSCNHKSVKIRSSAGDDSWEVEILASQDKAKHEEVSRALRFCCQHAWVIPWYVDDLGMGLDVVSKEAQTFSGSSLRQPSYLSIQLSWIRRQDMRKFCEGHYDFEGFGSPRSVCEEETRAVFRSQMGLATMYKEV